MKRWSTYLMILGVFALSACGFHLRGLNVPLAPLPFESLYIDNSTNLGSDLNSVLRRDSRITLTSMPNAAEAVLKVYGEQIHKDILTINSAGNINEYLLTFRVEAQVLKNGVLIGEPMTILIHRTLGYSDSTILGKQDEESLLWRDMRLEAAERIARRLSFLTPFVEPSNPNDAVDP